MSIRYWLTELIACLSISGSHLVMATRGVVMCIRNLHVGCGHQSELSDNRSHIHECESRALPPSHERLFRQRQTCAAANVIAAKSLPSIEVDVGVRMQCWAVAKGDSMSDERHAFNAAGNWQPIKA